MKYSILAIPPEPVYGQLYNIIKRLSKKHLGPLFEPHLTLLSNIDIDLNLIQEKIEKLTNNLNPFELSFDCISFSTTYFQSVFIRVKSTAELLQLNLDVKKVLDIENTVFMPHISLLYGDHDMRTREQIATKIKIPPVSFTINNLSIWPEVADIDKWKDIKTFYFKGKG